MPSATDNLLLRVVVSALLPRACLGQQQQARCRAAMDTHTHTHTHTHTLTTSHLTGNSSSFFVPLVRAPGTFLPLLTSVIYFGIGELPALQQVQATVALSLCARSQTLSVSHVMK